MESPKPGQHFAVITASAETAYRGEYELRDALVILMPGQTLFAHLYRAPLSEKTIAAQVLVNGHGGLWIDGCRIATSDNLNGGAYAVQPTHRAGLDMWTQQRKGDTQSFKRGGGGEYTQPPGRWPSNLLLVHSPLCGSNCVSDCPIPLLDQQSGTTVSTGGRIANITPSKVYGGGKGLGSTLAGKRTSDEVRGDPGFGDEGGASRYFPQFASLSEALDWIDRLLNGDTDGSRQADQHVR